MRLFQSESQYNVKTGKWEEYFWIDGKEVDGDAYFYEMEIENKLENDKLLKQIEIEEEDECDCCDCIECTLDRFVDQIQEINGGCPHCIREVLQEFLCEIVEHIVIEDAEEDINRENKNLN